MFNGSGPDEPATPAPQGRPLSRAGSSVRSRLIALADVLIQTTLSEGAIVEGVVTSMYRPPYRRLDCDGRTLAYVRLRPKKNHVRVDITGLWLVAERAPRLRVSGAAGTMSLVARDEAEIAEIAKFLINTVARTRAAFAKRSR